jgi:hypothetical protein
VSALQDLEAIAPEEGQLTVGGIPCRVKHIRIREVLLLARIMAGGMGWNLEGLSFDDPDELKGELVGVLIVSVAAAAEESLEFLKTVVEPVNPDQAEQLRGELDNPEVADALDIINTLLDQEQDNLVSILGKAKGLTATVQKAFPKKEKPADGEPDLSPDPST